MKEQRDLVVKIAKQYCGTPYHPTARLKNIGVDCLTLLSCVWEDAGLLPRVAIPHYSPDFMLHRADEQYMAGLMKYTHEVESPQPADIALWKFGRCFSHAAIVIEWPMVIHAYVGRTVQYEDVEKAEWLSKNGAQARPLKFFSFWGE